MNGTQNKLMRFLLPLLLLLLYGQVTLAYYDPGLQRWINRDPLGEKGFQLALRAPATQNIDRSLQVLAKVFLRATPRKPGGFTASWGNNAFAFVGNGPLDHVDPLGLSRCPCTMAAPIPDTSPACDRYGGATYPGGISLKCFCKCAGNSAWSQQVRGWLACAFADGTDVVTAHKMCYAAAGGLLKGPIFLLEICLNTCGGVGLPPVDTGWP